MYFGEMSFGVYTVYMCLVYVTPMIGGILADKILCFRKAIFLGGILMALALIIVGNGFFKPNISSFVGNLYEKGDVRRDAGFTIFYMGINIGGAIAPLACAWFVEIYGCSVKDIQRKDFSEECLTETK